MRQTVKIEVPAGIYKQCLYIIQPEMQKWLYIQKLCYTYSHTTSGAKSPIRSMHDIDIFNHYVIFDMDESDATAFKLQFPHCNVRMLENKK